MKRGQSVKILMLLLIAIVLSSSAAGMGVTPASKVLNYEPGVTVPIDFAILNSEEIDINLSLSSVQDEGIIFFESSQLSLISNEYRTPFKVLVKMPENMEPGIHTLFFKLTPVIPESSDMFKAFASPRVAIKIRVPFPSKYADVIIAITQVDEGTPVPINLEFDNLGTEDISIAGGSLTLYDFKGDMIHEMTLPSISIPMNSFDKTEGEPRPILRKGTYVAKSKAFYDFVKLDLVQNFSMGAPDINIVRLTDNKIYVDEINEVNFIALLDWDVPITVKGYVLADEQQTEMPLFTIVPGEETEVKGFFDASGIGTGYKDIVIRLAYGAKVQDYQLRARFVEHGVVETLDDSKIGLIITFSILLVVGVLVLILFWFMRHKPTESKEDDSAKKQPIDASSETPEQKDKESDDTSSETFK